MLLSFLVICAPNNKSGSILFKSRVVFQLQLKKLKFTVMIDREKNEMCDEYWLDNCGQLCSVILPMITVAKTSVIW